MSSNDNQVSKTYKGKALFRNTYQVGLLSIFFAGGPKPLHLWEQKIQNGFINRYLDPELKALVVEIGGNNVSTTYINCPKNSKDSLGIRLPFLVMVAKNLKKYFTFEVTVLDDHGVRRRFRVANFQSSTQILPMCTVMPIGLADGWNQIQFNLSDFTYRAYKTQFTEVVRVKVNANILLRRIYFAQRLLSEEELPDDYKLFLPLSTKGKKRFVLKNDENKENIPRPSSKMEINAGEEKRVSKPNVSEPINQEGKPKSDASISMHQGSGVVTEEEVEHQSKGSLSEKESKEKQIEEEQTVQRVKTGVATELQTMQQTDVIEGVTGLIMNKPAVDNAQDTMVPQVDYDDKDMDGLKDEYGDTTGHLPLISQVKLQPLNRSMTQKDFVPVELQ